MRVSLHQRVFPYSEDPFSLALTISPGVNLSPVSGESYSRETATQRLSSLRFSRSNWLSSVGELPESNEHLVTEPAGKPASPAIYRNCSTS